MGNIDIKPNISMDIDLLRRIFLNLMTLPVGLKKQLML